MENVKDDVLKLLESLKGYLGQSDVVTKEEFDLFGVAIRVLKEVGEEHFVFLDHKERQ